MKYNNMDHYELQAVNPDGLDRLRAERMAWRVKRMGTNRLSKLIRLAGYDEKYVERAELCAGWLKFGTFSGERKLLNANFCHLRLCPICVARGAIVRGRLLSRVMDGVQAEHRCQYIFVTLALRNVPGDKLGEAITQLTDGWRRLVNQRPVQRAFKGWFRAIEITRNTDDGEWYGTYHPHIHAIFAVEDDYFHDAKLYFEQGNMLARWQMAARVDYKPTCHMEATHDGKKKRRKKRKSGGTDEASKGATLEAAKYATKDKDYIDPRLSDEEAAQVVKDYMDALDHRRLTAYGGWLKEMAVRLRADDLDNVDLLSEGDGKVIREDLAEVIEEYGWHFGAGDYVLARRYVNPLRIKREGQEDGKQD